MKSFNEFIGESKIETILIDGLEIWPEELGKMSVNRSVSALNQLGPGWRLPTLEEFKEILYPHREKLSVSISDGDNEDYYWSSSEKDEYRNYCFGFDRGWGNNFDDANALRILAVRDVTAEKAIDTLFGDL